MQQQHDRAVGRARVDVRHPQRAAVAVRHLGVATASEAKSGRSAKRSSGVRSRSIRRANHESCDGDRMSTPSLRWQCVCLDASDPRAIASFWQEALGCAPHPRTATEVVPEPLGTAEATYEGV